MGLRSVIKFRKRFVAKRKTISIPDDQSRHLMPIVGGLVVLAVLVGIFWLLYRSNPVNYPAEYEGVIADKWAGYSESDEGSQPYFRLLVELPNGQKLTVRVPPDLYNQAKVGSRIRKSSKGLELIDSATDINGFVFREMCRGEFGFAATAAHQTAEIKRPLKAWLIRL